MLSIEKRLTPAAAAEVLRDLGINEDVKSLSKKRYLRRGPAFVRVSGRCYYELGDLIVYARGEKRHTVESLERAAMSSLAESE